MEFSRLAAEPRTVKRYGAFRDLCSTDDWQTYESRVLQLLSEAPRWIRSKSTWSETRRTGLPGCLLNAVSGRRFSPGRFTSSCPCPHPKDRLSGAGLGLLHERFAPGRHHRAEKGLRSQAEILLRIRHLMLEVINDRKRWEDLAGRIKRENLSKPAFQEEFARVIPGWERLHSPGETYPKA